MFSGRKTSSRTKKKRKNVSRNEERRCGCFEGREKKKDLGRNGGGSGIHLGKDGGSEVGRVLEKGSFLRGRREEKYGDLRGEKGVIFRNAQR